MDLSRPHPGPDLLGVLENVRSLWNVGSIFRSADGAGVGQLLLCGFTGHPPRREISKTALGAEKTVAWEYWSRAEEACRALRHEGYQVLALERTAQSRSVDEIELGSRVALVVGHETTGIGPRTVAACDAVVELPMRGVKESLNVAVAFGIAAYALRARLEARATDSQMAVRRRREIS